MSAGETGSAGAKPKSDTRQSWWAEDVDVKAELLGFLRRHPVRSAVATLFFLLALVLSGPYSVVSLMAAIWCLTIAPLIKPRWQRGQRMVAGLFIGGSLGFFIKLVEIASIEAERVPVGQGFSSFRGETRRASAALSCPRPRTTPAADSFGALYGCIMGSAETAKFWINEDPSKRGRVEDAKVMWNDYWRNTGYGVHADAAEAQMMVRAFSRLYAPGFEAELLDVFRGDQPHVFAAGGFNIEYRFDRGPGINTRLLIATER